MEPAHDSLERLVPDRLDRRDTTGVETLELHRARYAFAAQHVMPGRVLDLACGVGYGAGMLAEREGVSVLGVDVSAEAIQYARERYAGDRVEFRVADAMSFDDPEGFTAVVSLETVEHVEDPEGLLVRLVRLLHPEGTLIASVPTTPSVDLNPHHLHDFTERSFRRSLEALGLEEIDALCQVQRVSPLAVLSRRETRMSDLRSNLPSYYARHPGALLRRIGATLRYGFSNRYLTVASRRPS